MFCVQNEPPQVSIFPSGSETVTPYPPQTSILTFVGDVFLSFKFDGKTFLTFDSFYSRLNN